ncbi:MAG: alpha-L-rhamnosidase, partial [Eubacteriales bacterium]
EKTDAAYTARVGEAFVREFYDPAQHLFTDTKNTAHTASHSNFLAMYVGLDRYVGEDIRASIVSLIRERGFCMGVYMSYFMLAALKKAGYEALAVEMLKSPDGWCKMLSEGATTLFEAWGKEQKWNTSLCHPWAAAPILILADPM